MEEGERDDGATEPHPGPSPSNVQMLQISGFADNFVASILKESIQESGVEPIWAITCSSDCHNHTKAIPGVEGGMQLCWTPESPVAPSSPSQAPCQSHCRHHQSLFSSSSTARTDESPTRCSISKSNIICQTARNCHVTSDLAGKSIQSSPKDIKQSVDNEEQLYAKNECANRSSDSVANRHTVAEWQSPQHPKSGEVCVKDSATLASAKEYLQELGSVRRLSVEQMAFSDPSDIIAQSAEHLAVNHFHNEENGGTASSLRKGMSVNDVTSGGAIEGICAKEFTQQQFTGPDLSPKNPKRVGFLRQLGRGLRRSREEQGVEACRSKKGMRSFRKTLSSLFSLKGRWREEDSGPGGRGKRPTSAPVVGLFKLPARKTRHVPPSKRALPPVPSVDSLPGVEPPSLTPLLDESAEIRDMEEGDWPVASEHSPDQGSREGEATNQMKFAASIEKVKDQGWYWGPISGEAAEKILAKEPDGSFVVRDSSDHHYIFSLTFKLNGFVRHVRIEHDQGNFSFGSFTKFKSNTIVDFIENAVEHSRSGRYLFFLHRRPVLGPMRVQLLHPVSRFKEVQSLQHMCRYVIVKHVRRDLLNQLPVPTRMKQYLNTPFYYSEQVAEEAEDNPNMHAVDQHDPFSQFADEANTVEHDSEEARDNTSLDNDRLFGRAEASVSSPVPRAEASVSPVPRGEASVSSPVPRGEASVSSPVPRGEASVSSPVPRGEASVSSPVPRAEASVSSPVPRDEASVSSTVPRAEASVSSPVPNSDISQSSGHFLVSSAPPDNGQKTQLSSSSSLTPPVAAETCRDPGGTKWSSENQAVLNVVQANYHDSSHTQMMDEVQSTRPNTEGQSSEKR